MLFACGLFDLFILPSWACCSDCILAYTFPGLMLELVEDKDRKVKELQDNIVAVNYTPQSKMGKKLMAKCRTQFEENVEIETRLMKRRY